MAGALDGLRVIDFTTNLSGPYCAMLLGDQGADVVKVERPEGEAMRQTPPFVNGESAPFMLWNRNKRSVALDLKAEDGFQAARDLCISADIAVENFRPGVMARLGLGYEALAAENPGLVMTSISGFGQTGPYGSRGGFDLITQAMSGLAATNGPEDGPPFRLPIAISDVGAGMFGAYATMVAIHGRTQTGKGQHVDVSLYESAMSFCVYEAAGYFATGKTPERIGQRHRGSSPYQILRAKDGYLAVGGAQQNLWFRICNVLGRPDLPEDPRFKTRADRVANNDALIEIIEGVMQTRNRGEWLVELEEVGVPAGPGDGSRRGVHRPPHARPGHGGRTGPSGGREDEHDRHAGEAHLHTRRHRQARAASGRAHRRGPGRARRPQAGTARRRGGIALRFSTGGTEKDKSRILGGGA